MPMLGNMKRVESPRIDLSREGMLGYWDIGPHVSQCEYQVECRLVYIQYPKGGSAQPYIEGLRSQLHDAWCDIDNAVAFAEEQSRPLIPDFWEAHDRSGKVGSRFDVYSIRFNYPDSRPVYYVSSSHDFEYSWTRYEEYDLWQESPITEQLPEPPDRFFIEVRRLGPGLFEKVA